MSEKNEDSERGRKEHDMKDRDSQPKGYGKGERTPGIKMGAYKNGEHFHDCSRKD